MVHVGSGQQWQPTRILYAVGQRKGIGSKDRSNKGWKAKWYVAAQGEHCGRDSDPKTYRRPWRSTHVDYVTQASVGSAFAANVNAQSAWFKVADIQFESDNNYQIGLVSEDTLLDIRLGPISNQSTLPTNDCIDAAQDISKFIGKAQSV